MKLETEGRFEEYVINFTVAVTRNSHTDFIFTLAIYRPTLKFKDLYIQLIDHGGREI
jgi:hypothetical protein